MLYSAQLPNFIEWVAQRIYSNSSPYIGKVALKILHSYLAVIYSIYINCILLVTVFENILLYYILNGVIVLPNTGTRLVPEYFCLILEQIVLKAEQIVYRFELLYSGLITSFQNRYFKDQANCNVV